MNAKKALKEKEKISAKWQQTQLFIETPYRNNAFVEDAINTLRDETYFGIATDITLESEYICSHAVRKWKKKKVPDLHKRPTIFMLLAR
jgi:16S rRNA (cytidine1402-2'-O)-methyltransferase